MAVKKAIVAAALIALMQGPASAAQGRAPAKNVVVISIDALRPDHLGCYGYPRATSPAMDALAAGGVVFENALSSSNWTPPAVNSIRTGCYPYRHGVFDWTAARRPAGDTAESLFRNAGFSVNFIWDNSQDLTNRDEGLTRKAMEWLRALDGRRFFLWIHYLGAHGPYAPPAQYRDMFLGDAFSGAPEDVAAADSQFLGVGGLPGYVVEDGKSDRNHYIALYDGAVRYADSQVQLLIRQIRDLGLEGETVFIVTADHGESLGNHEYYFHHGFYLYDDIVKVPLIISGAGVDGRGVSVRAQVRTIDILPTLLELAGVAAGEPAEGESLCPVLDGKGMAADREAFITDGRRSALRAGGWKLIYTDPSVPLLGFEKLHDAGDIVNFFAWEIRRKISTPFLRDAVLSYAAWVRSLAKAGYAGRGGGLRRRFVESQIGLMHRLFSDTWELYDLTADPGERHNLVRREKTRFAGMKKTLQGYLKRKVRAARGEDLSEEMKRKLRGLGYAQ